MRRMVIAAFVILAIVRMGMATPETQPKKEGASFSGRSYLHKILLRWLPGDGGALAAGLLLGGDDDLSFKAVTDFRRAGLSHITAASGYNVVVVAGWVMTMLTGQIGKKASLYTGMVCIILYMLLAGMTVPVIRAGIMVMMGYIGILAGRRTDAWWSLGAVSLGMIIYKPVWAFDISFQLSVAATVGVIYAGSGMETTINNKWLAGLVNNLKTSVAAWATTLPIILHYFGQLSLVAPVANLGVVWAVPPVMEVLGLAAAIGLVWDTGGWLVSLMAWPGLKFMLTAASWFSAWPGANVQIEKMAWIWVVVYYAAIGLIAEKLKKRSAYK